MPDKKRQMPDQSEVRRDRWQIRRDRCANSYGNIYKLCKKGEVKICQLSQGKEHLRPFSCLRAHLFAAIRQVS